MVFSCFCCLSRRLGDFQCSRQLPALKAHEGCHELSDGERAQVLARPRPTEDPLLLRRESAVGKRLVRVVVRIILLALIASGIAYWIVQRDLVHEESGSIRRLIGSRVEPTRLRLPNRS